MVLLKTASVLEQFIMLTDGGTCCILNCPKPIQSSVCFYQKLLRTNQVRFSDEHVFMLSFFSLWKNTSCFPLGIIDVGKQKDFDLRNGTVFSLYINYFFYKSQKDKS